MWALRTRCVRQVCSTHYPPEVIAAWAASPAPALYPQLIASAGAVLAEDASGRLRGFGVADLAGSEIDGLFVDPNVRGSGLGRCLLQALEAKLLPGARIHLAAALNAVAFYQAQGYVVLRQGRYAHPSGIALACTYMENTPGRRMPARLRPPSSAPSAYVCGGAASCHARTLLRCAGAACAAACDMPRHPRCAPIVVHVANRDRATAIAARGQLS